MKQALIPRRTVPRRIVKTAVKISPRKITEKQIESARANGAKSRGPVTSTGKINSSVNRLRHGLLARTVVFEGESRERFSALVQAFAAELEPETPIEHLLVQKLAVAHWRQVRIWSLEKASIEHETGKQDIAGAGDSGNDPATRDALAFRALGDQSRSAPLMNICEMRYDRQFTRTLSQYMKFRAARKLKNEQTNPVTHSDETDFQI